MGATNRNMDEAWLTAAGMIQNQLNNWKAPASQVKTYGSFNPGALSTAGWQLHSSSLHTDGQSSPQQWFTPVEGFLFGSFLLYLGHQPAVGAAHIQEWS